MKRRWLKWFVLLAVLGVAGFACYVWLAPGGGVNRMTVLRIKAGMSHEQVEAVIGLPHGGRGIVAGYGEFREWCGDAGTINVWFDEAGRVTGRDFSPSESSCLDKVYRWIGIDTEGCRPPVMPTRFSQADKP
jgi:hypothetical protein